MQGPEPAVPDVAVALPGGGRAEPAGLELRGRGAGAARQERPLDGQRPLHLPRRQRRQGGRGGHAAEAACREQGHGQKVMMGVVPRDQDRQFLPRPMFWEREGSAGNNCRRWPKFSNRSVCFVTFQHFRNISV